MMMTRFAMMPAQRVQHRFGAEERVCVEPIQLLAEGERKHAARTETEQRD